MRTATWSSSTPRADAAVLRARILDSLEGVRAGDWNALDLAGRPFLRHEFLAEAERSGSATAGTGWSPAHVVVERAGRLVGAMPLYRKDHSWGEFVFDFAWARAYEQHGLAYYPKLVAAVPFTPASGPRLLLHPDSDAEAVRAALLDAARDHARAIGASSLHVLFPSAPDREWLAAQGLMSRLDCQFHWQNRGFRDFDDFLGTFTAEKRKKVRRERRRVQEAGIEFLAARQDLPRTGQPALLHAQVLPGTGRLLARGADGQARAAARTARRHRRVPAWGGHALRTLLGRGRGLPQPALRGLLLPGHRLLHPRGLAAAPRANTRSPAASHPKPSGRCTRSSIPRSAPRSATTWDVNGITCRPTWRPSRDTSPSGVPSPTVP